MELPYYVIYSDKARSYKLVRVDKETPQFLKGLEFWWNDYLQKFIEFSRQLPKDIELIKFKDFSHAKVAFTQILVLLEKQDQDLIKAFEEIKNKGEK